MTNEFPRDEFDEIAEHGGPVGVHRAPRPWWHLVVIPLVVFVAAGLLAFGVATLLWNSGDGSGDADPTASATVSPTVSSTASPDATASTAPSDTAEPAPSDTAEPEPVIVYDTPIAVLNGTGISGLAGSQQGELESAGFTAVTAANLDGAEPGANTVVYADAALADTAAAVAAALGIDAVAQGTPQSDADIEVQLVTDPR